MIISKRKSTSAFIAFSLEPSCHDMRWIRLTIRLRQNESEHHLRQTLRKPYETQEKCTFQMNYFQPNTKWVRGTLERCSHGFKHQTNTGSSLKTYMLYSKENIHTFNWGWQSANDPNWSKAQSLNWLVVSTCPSEKYESHLESLFPIYGKIQ